MTAPVDAVVEKITEQIIGGAFEVSRLMGHGFLEAVYRKCLGHELRLRGLAYREEVAFHIAYKANPVGTYIADLIVEERVIVELKAVEALNSQHTGQLLNYLKAADLSVGLLLNFGKPRLELKRVLR
ncbi:MAG: GxxExxY protein [Magnetospirillum sp.]|nr:GxxExxY protein [Magnetospirillum sp.]